MFRSVLLLLSGALGIAALAFLLLRSGADESRAPAVRTPSAAAVAHPALDARASTPLATFRAHGRVVDERDAPVREAQLHAAAPPHGLIHAETDASGRFQIQLPAGGDWQLAASAEGFLPWEEVVAVTAGEVEIVVKLHAAAQLAGQVRGGSDSAQYLVSLENAAGEAQQAQSDSSGRYRFAVLEPGTYRVGLQANGTSWDDVGKVTVKAGERATFDIMVPESGGAIELTARLPGGGAADHPARVELLELAANRQSDRTTVLSQDGRARLDGIPPGNYKLRVHAHGAPPSKIIPVEVQAGLTAHVIVEWGGSRVAGRVTGPTGAGALATVRVQRVSSRGDGAVPDAEVLFETRTSADGAYSVEGLLPGDYLLSARGDGYVAERFHVAASEPVSVDLAFPAAGHLDVTVETADGPVAGAMVFAVREPLSDWAEQAKTDAGGRARISSIPAGSYRVVATLAGADAVRTAVAHARISAGGQSTVALFVGGK